MDMDKDRERRIFIRVNGKHPINVICSGEVVKGFPEHFIFRTFTENLSEGGIKVILEKEVKVGSLVKLELFITDKESMPVICDGLIVWTKKANPEGVRPEIYHTGIKLLNLTNPVDHNFLVEVVNFYLSKKSEEKK